jgi:hypothetical protein
MEDDNDGEDVVCTRGEKGIGSSRISEDALAASYLQSLGPMRIDFVSGNPNSKTDRTTTTGGGGGLPFHSFLTTPASIKLRKDARTLRKELIEYMLNLPITKHGSIFVRVEESRLDLIRAMITGEYTLQMHS